MNGVEVRAIDTRNGNLFVFEVNQKNNAVYGEGYYVTPDGELLRVDPKTKKGPRRKSAMSELHWAKNDWGHELNERVITGPLAEKLSNLFDSRIPKKRSFGPREGRELNLSPFAELKTLLEAIE
ncbi:MAG: hypothetical protein QG585_284 [Patescibacteria group bacterium]|nr:hypothetical protein [Patescibacteria group bacterium]